MSRLAANVRANVEKRKQVVATNIVNDLIGATPVLTGLAQSNWQVTIGEPAEGVVDVGSRPTVPLPEKGQVIYIVNNVPYIQYLNDGSSTQAPAGFVEAAIARFHTYGATFTLTGGPDLG